MDGTFIAGDMLMKCPSKYNEQSHSLAEARLLSPRPWTSPTSENGPGRPLGRLLLTLAFGAGLATVGMPRRATA